MTDKVPERIPFEPGNRNKQKVAKTPSASPTAAKASLKIPDAVNKRIVRRMALFCGIPTFLGFATFIVSYIIVINHWAELPNSLVVLLSMLFMGIGVLGLSYGAISACWDESRVGNWWGWQEFKQNFGYLTAAYKAQRLEKTEPK